MAQPKPHYANANTLVEKQEQAMEEARRQLAKEGIVYPVFDPTLTADENYGRMLAYAEQESHLIVEIMRRPVNPRPLVLDNVEPRQHFASCYDK
jgi:hypothetical protein